MNVPPASTTRRQARRSPRGIRARHGVTDRCYPEWLREERDRNLRRERGGER